MLVQKAARELTRGTIIPDGIVADVESNEFGDAIITLTCGCSVFADGSTLVQVYGKAPIGPA